MMLVVAGAVLLMLGCFPVSARRVFNALLRPPYGALETGQAALGATAARTSVQVREGLPPHPGRKVLGAALCTAFAIAFVLMEIEAAQLSIDTLFDLGMDGPGLGLGHLMVGATILPIVFGGWVCFEASGAAPDAGFLLLGELQPNRRKLFVQGAALASALSLVVALVFAFARAEASTAMVASQVPPDALLAGADDPLAALLGEAGPGPASPAQAMPSVWVYRLVLLLQTAALAIVAILAFHLGPLPLASLVGSLALLILAVLPLRLLQACLAVPRGALVWLWAIGSPAMELLQKLAIALVRPVVTLLRQVHNGAVGGSWRAALTGWAFDLETPVAPVGEATLVEGVALVAEQPSLAGEDADQAAATRDEATPAAEWSDHHPEPQWEAFPPPSTQPSRDTRSEP